MVRTLAVMLGLMLAAPAPAPGQGILFRARRATDGKARVAPVVVPVAPAPAGPRGPAPPPPPRTDDTEPMDLEAWLALGALAGLGVTSPVWAPYLLLEPGGPAQAYFPGHPYALPVAHYLGLRNGPPANEDTMFLDRDYLKPWGLRGGVEDGTRFEGLNRLGGRMLFDTTSRWGLTTNWDYFHERLPEGGSDEMVLGDLELTYRFAQCDWVQLHLGVGGRGLFDRHMVRGGFNLLYSAAIYPVEPLVITASGEAGHINKAFTMRLRTSAGWQYRRAEVFVGYDWLRIGGADLHGPMAGLRLSF